MARVEVPELWRVIVREYERGWGSSVIDSPVFDCKEEAEEYARSVNSKNKETSAPDYYIQAEGPYRV